MGQLGLHIRINDHELALLEGLGSEDAICDEISERLEEHKFESGEFAETDKSWAYLHAGLMGSDPYGPLCRAPSLVQRAKGGFLSRFFGSREKPAEPDLDTGLAKYAIVGLEDLVSSDDAFVGLTRKADVPRVADALSALTRNELERLVAKAHRDFEADGDPADAASYAGSWFEGLVEFYRAAADNDQHVVFSVNF